MNPIIEAIRMRRSVRSYKPVPIPKDIIEAIIDAGNEAPSALNSQPWRFVVVQDAEVRNKLLRAALPHAKNIIETIKESHPERYEVIKKRYSELKDPIYYSAPVILFVIGSSRYADSSCPLACQNIMLAAHSLGIGSCWVGFGSMVCDDREIRDILELGQDEKIYGPIILGYPDGYPERPPKKAPLVKWV
jgi:nitroreductase